MKVVGALALSLAVGSGCLTPPALLPATEADLAKALVRYPEGTEVVSVEVEPGVSLRGVFVPSDADAPIVLHLLESSGSCASQRFHFGPLTRQLSDLGFASLILDYTGVGASDGETSVTHLGRDATAMWQEAVRRAGSEDRVYLRATSLGAIPAALLLKEGARPAGMVLVAPVFADSATARFAKAFHGGFVGWTAALVFRDIADVDLPTELKKANVPTTVVAAKDDLFLLQEDRQRIWLAFSKSESRMFVRPGGHLQLCLEAHWLLPEEESYVFAACCSKAAIAARLDRVLRALPDSIATRFRDTSDARVRLERLVAVQRTGDPVLIAAAAISVPRVASATHLLWIIAQSPYPPLDFDELCAVLSLSDPAGEVPIDLIDSAARDRDLSEQVGGVWVPLRADSIARATLHGGRDSSTLEWATTATFAGDQSVTIGYDASRTWQALVARGLNDDDVARQFMRVLLKAHRVPDRLRYEADGKVVLETKGDDGWTVLDPQHLPPPQPVQFVMPRLRE